MWVKADRPQSLRTVKAASWGDYYNYKRRGDWSIRASVTLSHQPPFALSQPTFAILLTSSSGCGPGCQLPSPWLQFCPHRTQQKDWGEIRISWLQWSLLCLCLLLVLVPPTISLLVFHTSHHCTNVFLGPVHSLVTTCLPGKPLLVFSFWIKAAEQRYLLQLVSILVALSAARMHCLATEWKPICFCLKPLWLPMSFPS